MSQESGEKIKRLQNPVKSAFATDFILTTITQIVVMLGSFFVYGLIARLFTATGVGEFALIKRALYLLQPIVLLGITVAIPRFLPMHHDKMDRAQIATIGFVIVMVFSIVTAIIILYARNWFALLIFGSPHTEELVASLSAMTVAFGMHSYVYCYFRGTRQMNLANVLDIINSAVFPLAAVVGSARFNVAVSFFVLATLTVLWTAFMARPLWREIWISIQRNYSSALTKSLLKYGLPRIPGDFALAGMVLGAPWLVAQYSNLSEVGHFAVAQTLLIVPGAGLASLAIVLLPFVSERLAFGDIKAVKTHSVRLFQAIFDNSIYFCFHVSIMADVILRLWVGQSMLGASILVRILMVAVPFYATYFVFRSVIDASTSRPITTVNLVIAFGVFVICFYVLMHMKLNASVAAALSLSIGYLVLGMLTYIALIKFYGTQGFFDKKTVEMLIYNCIIAIGILLPRYLFKFTDVILLACEALALFVYITITVKIQREWAYSLLRKLKL